MTQRTATFSRNTKETDINIAINLDDNTGPNTIDTPAPFFNHMLEQIIVHGHIGLSVKAAGDTEIDDHHLVEDIGITMGQTFLNALGNKKGLTRYGHAYAPLDESLTRVVLDISGRPGLFYNANITRARVGNFDVDLIREFFQGFVNHAKITLHIDQLKGQNAHHQIESMFKAFSLALKEALHIRSATIPSSKGAL